MEKQSDLSHTRSVFTHHIYTTDMHHCHAIQKWRRARGVNAVDRGKKRLAKSRQAL